MRSFADLAILTIGHHNQIQVATGKKKGRGVMVPFNSAHLNVRVEKGIYASFNFNQEEKHDVLFSILHIQYTESLMSLSGNNTFNPLDVSDGVQMIKQLNEEVIAKQSVFCICL